MLHLPDWQLAESATNNTNLEVGSKPPARAAAKISSSMLGLKVLKLKWKVLAGVKPVGVLLHSRMPLSLLLLPPLSRDETQSEVHRAGAAD